MYQNESNPALRTIPARLFDGSGNPLPLNHTFGINDLKIIQPTGAITNASALPVSVSGASPGTFTVQVSQAELQNLGNVRWELSGSGVTYWEWAETIVMPPAQASVVVTAAQLVSGSRYSLVSGDLKSDMLITLSAPGAIAALPTAQAANMLWTKPDGTTVTVPLIVVSPGNGTSGAVLKRVWSAGDTALAGLHKGTVRITDSAGNLCSDPNDGSHMCWWIYAALGTPGTD